MDAYHTEPRKPSGAGKFVFVILLMLVAGLGYLGYAMLGSGGGSTTPQNGGGASVPGNPADGAPVTTTNNGDSSPRAGERGSGGERTVINIAYGTEKKLWLQWAAAEFAKSPEGRRIEVNLVGRGSVEGARDVLNGPGSTPIHVWSPASSAYRDVFETEWQLKMGRTDPILRAENLVLTPMVFVMWDERFKAFEQKFGEVSFTSLASAMQEPGGWSAIADKSEWGLFKFGHTDPNKSNSGLLTLVLMGYDKAGKDRGLTVGDITGAEFQKWLRQFVLAVARPSGELTHSTGTLMEEMVLRGPSQYDVIMVYENLALGYLKAAEGRSGRLHIAYPRRNYWNENPYYILDVPWSDKEQRRAAAAFLDFLMTRPIQERALDYGFRPGNPQVAINGPDSPFVQHADYGVRIDI
ncbi:MAG: substrate-binding domain-containing protein, partial [Phycisphaerales bacterium]|nr:substrate-binding domain-containing protein [Phycisphaerales bacterium]